MMLYAVVSTPGTGGLVCQFQHPTVKERLSFNDVSKIANFLLECKLFNKNIYSLTIMSLFSNFDENVIIKKWVRWRLKVLFVAFAGEVTIRLSICNSRVKNYSNWIETNRKWSAGFCKFGAARVYI